MNSAPPTPSDIYNCLDTTRAVQLLTQYYAAMNSHSVEAVLLFLDDDIAVDFPEADRNWNSIATAKEKFSDMFVRLPTFTGGFEVIQCEAKGTTDEKSDGIFIQMKCRFSCIATEMQSRREMRYLVSRTNWKIKEIHHL
jgi:hypothetical protein